MNIQELKDKAREDSFLQIWESEDSQDYESNFNEVVDQIVEMVAREVVNYLIDEVEHDVFDEMCIEDKFEGVTNYILSQLSNHRSPEVSKTIEQGGRNERD